MKKKARRGGLSPPRRWRSSHPTHTERKREKERDRKKEYPQSRERVSVALYVRGVVERGVCRRPTDRPTDPSSRRRQQPFSSSSSGVASRVPVEYHFFGRYIEKQPLLIKINFERHMTPRIFFLRMPAP